MARIQRVQRQSVASTVDAGAISRAAAPFQQVAQVAGAFAERQERIETASAKAEVAKANSELNGKYRSAFDQNKQSFSNDPKGGAEAFTKSIDDITNQQRSSLTTDRAKQLFNQTSLKLKDGYTNKRAEWQDTQVTANVFKDLEQTTQSTALQAYDAGKAGDFDAFITNMEVSQDLIVASAGTVTPENIEKISDSSRKAQVDGFMDGMTRNNPVEAVALLNSGRLDDLITPQEKDGLIDKAENRVQNDIATQAKILRDDPLKYLETQGQVVPEIELTDPDSFLDRAEFVDSQRAANPNIDIPMFRKEEVNFISNAIEKGNPTQITGLLAQLNQNSPADFMDDMAEQLFNETPSFGIALSLVGQDPAVSRDIIRGQQFVNARAIELPTDGAVTAAINSQLGLAIDDPNMINQIAQATKAAYASQVFDSGSDEPKSIDSNSEIFENALKNIIGDVAEVNDSKTVTFRDVKNRVVEADDFEDAFDDMTDTSIIGSGQSFPTSGGKTVDADFIKEWGKMVAVGDGIYRIHLRTNNTYLSDGKGNPYVLDFKAIYNLSLEE